MPGNKSSLDETTDALLLLFAIAREILGRGFQWLANLEQGATIVDWMRHEFTGIRATTADEGALIQAMKSTSNRLLRGIFHPIVLSHNSSERFNYKNTSVQTVQTNDDLLMMGIGLMCFVFSEPRTSRRVFCKILDTRESGIR
jgi:hypothetical protein